MPDRVIRKKKMMKSTRKPYDGIESHGSEAEYGIIAKMIKHEKGMLVEQLGYIHIFKGVNLASTVLILRPNQI